MARPGIRYEDVEQAAETLVRTHVNPTHERIRHALGGGSFTTIGRHLQTWRQGRAEEGGPAEEAIVPDTLVDAVKGVWQGMRGAAEARVTQVQEQAQTAVEEARSAAQAQLDALTQRHAEALAALAAERDAAGQKAQAEAALAHQRAEDAAAHHAQLRQSLMELETAYRQSLVDTAEAQGRAQALDKRCQTLQEALQSAEAAHSQAMSQAATQNRRQIEQLSAAHTHALAQIADERRDDKVAQAEALSRHESQLVATQDRCEQWKTACAQARLDCEQLQHEITRLTTARVADKKRLDQAESQAADHQQRAEQHQAALFSLRGETQGRLQMMQELREAFRALTLEKLPDQPGGD